MMKKSIVTLVLCLFAMNLQAQVLDLSRPEGKLVDETISPAVQEKIEHYAKQIRQIVIEQKLEMKEEISKIDKRLDSGEITVENADELKETIANDYSNKINEEIAKLDFDLDEITRKQVEYAIMNSDLDQLEKDKNQQVIEKRYRRVNEISGYFGGGILLAGNSENEALNNHLGSMSNIEFGMIYHGQLSKKSPFALITGIMFSWRTLRAQDNYYFNRDLSGEVNLIQHEGNLSKSKLRGGYIMIPLGLEYNFAPLTQKDEEEYRNMRKNNFALTGHVYGGFRMSHNNIVKGDDIKFRDRKTDFELRKFIYGAQLTFTYKNYNLFVRQEFSPLFQDGTFDNRKFTQIGIGLGF